MWCCNDVHAVMTYGTSAYYKAAPSAEQRATGVVPLDSLPAAWWNCMWCDTNSAINEARDAIGSFIDEVNTLLTNAGIQPNCNCVDTIYRAVNKIRQTIGDASVAGAVKSSSCPGEVSIDANGIMTANCVGNASSLTTTARTVVGAVNELKSTYDCCISDINSTMGGKAPTNHASSDCTYGVGNSTCYGHVKVSDTYTSLVGCACDGIAASQKAVNDLYQLIPQGESVQWDSTPIGSRLVMSTELGGICTSCICVCGTSLHASYSIPGALYHCCSVYGTTGASMEYYQGASGSTCFYSTCHCISPEQDMYVICSSAISSCDIKCRQALFVPRIRYNTSAAISCSWNSSGTATFTVSDADLFRHTQMSHVPMNTYDGKLLTATKGYCCCSGSAGYSTNFCVKNNASVPILLTILCRALACCSSWCSLGCCYTILAGGSIYVGSMYGCSCCWSSVNQSCVIMHVQPKDGAIIPRFFDSPGGNSIPSGQYLYRLSTVWNI